MTSLRYSKDHEYVRVEGDVATVGISSYAQSQLGDVVESVKAASEIYAPVAGEVITVNAELEANPALVNAEPEGEGWFLKLKITDAAELDELMDEAAYKAFVDSLG